MKANEAFSNPIGAIANGLKSLFRSIVAEILAMFARAILHKYHPTVVMVTGSVGKTSTKDAVKAVLSEQYFLRASEKSYNSEFGVPLTIIGAGNPWFSASKWLKVFQEAFALILFPNHYPKLLVLEVGADRPGDLKHILRIATPDAVVVTRLPDIPVHVEAYASAEAVREEEFAPAYMLPFGAPLVICADDPHSLRLSSRLSAHVVTFGFSEGATVRLGEVQVDTKKKCPAGMVSEAILGGVTYTLEAPCAVGRSQVFAPAAAFALAHALGMKPATALKGLRNYEPPSGRGKILKGIHDTTLIDDTYNSSPAAVEEVLASFPSIEASRRIAVLGDMLELGRYSVSEHERIGRLAAKYADVIVTVGARAQALASAARAEGKKEVYEYPDSYAAAPKVKEMLQSGDLVLIKGSQSMRMERITEALLQHTEDTVKLVRQESEWKEKR